MARCCCGARCCDAVGGASTGGHSMGGGGARGGAKHDSVTGVAVGSGWQATVAYINLGCYYIIGLPLGILMGLVFKLGVIGIWGGMIFGGTAIQTVILAVITADATGKRRLKKLVNG
ncbi:hypothetical protein ACOSQ2_010547 [Xanthoceras sorbifolium]